MAAVGVENEYRVRSSVIDTYSTKDRVLIVMVALGAIMALVAVLSATQCLPDFGTAWPYILMSTSIALSVAALLGISSNKPNPISRSHYPPEFVRLLEPETPQHNTMITTPDISEENLVRAPLLSWPVAEAS